MKTQKFRFKEITYELPTRWEDCTFGQYIDITKLKAKTDSKIMFEIGAIGILAGDKKLGSDLFEEVEYESLKPLIEKNSWITVEPDISKFKRFTEDQIIIIDEVKYKLKLNWDETLTNIELVTLEELMKSKKVVDYDIHELTFGLLFKRLNDDGTEVDISPNLIFDNINLFREKLKMDLIYSILYFFLSGKKTSSKEDSKFSSKLFQVIEDQEIIKPKKARKKKNQKSQ